MCIVKDGSNMRGIVWSGNDILYICDSGNHRILSYNIDTGTLSTLAGTGKYGHEDGNIKDATFYHPYRLAMDMNGDLYITEEHCVRKINLSKETVETIAGSDERGYLDGEAKKANFIDPYGIAVSSDGTIYVADQNNCIRQIKDGIVSTIAGTPGQKGNTDGRLRDSKFRSNYGLLLDDDGTFLVADREVGIRRVDINQDTVETLPLNIDYPYSLVTDSEGNLYVGTETSVYKIDGFGESRISASLNNMTTWKHIRLFLVGDSGAGKTSVVRWLKGDPFISKHNSTDSVDVTTADINSWQSVTFDIKDYMAQILQEEKKIVNSVVMNTVLSTSHSKNNSAANDNNLVATQNLTRNAPNPQQLTASERSPDMQVTLSVLLSSDLKSRIRKTQELSQAFHVWDFAGQEEYYNTHHFFLSDAAIYLLVVDISKPLDIPRVKFWLNSIKCYTEAAPIVLIGTHSDEISDAQDIVERIAHQLNDNAIKDKIAVSCKLDSPAPTRILLADTADSKVLKKPCKLSWLLLFDDFSKHKDLSSLEYLSITQVLQKSSQFQMDESETKLALQFFHDNGYVLFFDEEPLDHLIFTHPQQLINVFKTVITARGLKHKVSRNEFKMLQETGRMRPDTIRRIWKQYDAELFRLLKVLLQKFGLAFWDPVQVEQGAMEVDMIIPCLVKTPDTTFKNQFKEAPVQVTCSISTIPPLGFANRLIASIMAFTNLGGVSYCRIFMGGCTFTQAAANILITTSPGQVTIKAKQSKTPSTNQPLER